LIVLREDVTRVIQRLFAELALDDLSVKDPPVEQIIGRIFKRGQAEE
jgi:ABC-2 type transport system ATP-binding protein